MLAGYPCTATSTVPPIFPRMWGVHQEYQNTHVHIKSVSFKGKICIRVIGPDRELLHVNNEKAVEKLLKIWGIQEK